MLKRGSPLGEKNARAGVWVFNGDQVRPTVIIEFDRHGEVDLGQMLSALPNERGRPGCSLVGLDVPQDDET